MKCIKTNDGDLIPLSRVVRIHSIGTEDPRGARVDYFDGQAIQTAETDLVYRRNAAGTVRAKTPGVELEVDDEEDAG